MTRTHLVPLGAAVVCACVSASSCDAREGASLADALALRAPADAGPDAGGANVVAIAPRKAALEEKGSYPCSECHDESLAPDPKERVLTEAHDEIVLVHGAGRLWCTSCHHDDKGMLKGAKGTPIDFDMAHELCGECHYAEKHDFLNGAHGKRVGPWSDAFAGTQGARVATPCTACHDAHAPSIKPRMPWRASSNGSGHE